MMPLMSVISVDSLESCDAGERAPEVQRKDDNLASVQRELAESAAATAAKEAKAFSGRTTARSRLPPPPHPATRPKTVVFGRTVNVSQTIEATGRPLPGKTPLPQDNLPSPVDRQQSSPADRQQPLPAAPAPSVASRLLATAKSTPEPIGSLSDVKVELQLLREDNQAMRTEMRSLREHMNEMEARDAERTQQLEMLARFLKELAIRGQLSDEDLRTLDGACSVAVERKRPDDVQIADGLNASDVTAILQSQPHLVGYLKGLAVDARRNSPSTSVPPPPPAQQAVVRRPFTPLRTPNAQHADPTPIGGPSLSFLPPDALRYLQEIGAVRGDGGVQNQNLRPAFVTPPSNPKGALAPVYERDHLQQQQQQQQKYQRPRTPPQYQQQQQQQPAAAYFCSQSIQRGPRGETRESRYAVFVPDQQQLPATSLVAPEDRWDDDDEEEE